MIKAGDPGRGAKSRKLNRMLSIPFDHDCELLRWLLERGGVPYQEHTTLLMLHGWASGCEPLPVLVSNEASLVGVRQAFEYIDARLPADLRLYPDDPESVEKTDYWLELLLDKLSPALRRYAYSQLLPHKQLLLPLLGGRLPSWQQGLLDSAYPLLKNRIERSLPAGAEKIDAAQRQIDAVFIEIDALLADGRVYLLGDEPGIVDYAWAALTGPLLLPAQYGGELPDAARLPEAYRMFSERLRNTPAGGLALKMYREHRPARQATLDHHPASTTPQNAFSYYPARALAMLTGADVQRVLFSVLRKHRPVLVFGKKALITRDGDVREALARDTELTIAEINAPNMLRLNGPFFLGMDRSESYRQEQGALRKAVRPGDDRLIRDIVRRHCDDLIQAALPVGRIDMVSQLARPVARRFIADYLGVPGPDEITMMRWMRALFHDLFLNLSNKRDIQETAEQAYHSLGPYLLHWIAERKQRLQQGDTADDFLSRLIKMQLNGEIALDDDGIRRNISGLIVGALDTTSMASTLIVEQLLNKPEVLQRARSLADDEQALLPLLFDVFRFNTMAAAMRRYSHGVEIAGVLIPEGAEVFIATASAMFDENAWPEPYSVRTDRPLDRYQHFGDGLHRCFGEYINRIQIPLIVGALLRLPELKKSSGILYDGPFPDQFVLRFER